MTKSYLQITLFCLLLVTFQVAAQSIEPGLWRDKSSFTVNGVPLPSENQEECIKANQAKDVKAAIIKDLKEYNCVLTKWTVKGTRLEASLKCDREDLEATGTLKGQFGRKSYSLDGEAEGTYQQLLPAKAVVKLRGEWVKACP
jgi:hypothetical protein